MEVDMYVYISSEPGLWTVGFYQPDGKFVPESDHPSIVTACSRVSFLNGNNYEEHDNPKCPICRGAINIVTEISPKWARAYCENQTCKFSCMAKDLHRVYVK